MKTNKQLIAIARKQIGNGGSKYRNYVGAGGSWCDMFVFWLYDANGCGSLLPWKGTQRTYCPASIKWCQKNLAQIPPYLAMACDPIYFDWDKNGVPNHIGVVEERVSPTRVNTIEGNTSGGKVDDKKRAGYICGVFRPHFKPESVKLAQLAIDGQFDYNDIANLQRALKKLGTYTGPVEGVLGKNTVKGLQKVAKTTADGAWGNNTSKAVQKLIGAKQDGQFGVESVKALQRWINKQNSAEIKPEPTPVPTPPKKTRAEKITETAKELAWPKGTPTKKYAYKIKGSKPTAKMITALKKRGYNKRIDWSDCGKVLDTVIYMALGITTRVLKGVHEPFPKVSGFEVVWEGKPIPSGVLKPADIIRYKKKKKKKIKSQHALMYVGNNDLAEGGRGIRFFVIKHFKYLSKAKFNKKNVAFETLQVLRVKE